MSPSSPQALPDDTTVDRRVHGVGVGFRAPFFDALTAAPPPCIRWLEVSPENYLGRGGVFAAHLDALVPRWPVVTHGLSLSLGDLDPLDAAFMRSLRGFVERVGSPWHSDHLCFGAVDDAHLHDLLPIPHTREAVAHVADRVKAIEDLLGRPMAMENISQYARPGASDFDEAQFVTEVCERSDARLLLDVNNVYVNARNFGFDARDMIARMPLERVVQIHIAGHRVADDGLRIDTHGEPVCDDVYSLLAFALSRTGPVPVLLERDNNIPSFAEVVAEAERLDAIWRAALPEARP